MKQTESGGLLERGGELDSIGSALDQASEQTGSVIAIEGPAGIGKTALLEACRSAALDQGFRVLTARAGEREREFSWGVVRQLFDPVLQAATAAEAEKLWRGHAEGARALFEGSGVSPELDSSFAATHGLFWLAANMAEEQPVLIAVDDLHWCDGPSLSFLDYCARRLDGLPLSVAGTLRPNEPGADVALLDSFCSGPSAIVLQPRPLSPEASAELLRARLDGQAPANLARQSHEATGGNPLLLSELAATLRADGGGNPDDVAGFEGTGDLLTSGGRAVRRTVAARMRHAGEPARRLVEAAAVLGDESPLAMAVELASLTESEGDAAAVELMGIEVLSPGTTVRFVHPVVRAAIYDSIGPLERSRLHADAAKRLREIGAPIERVASHMLHVEPVADREVYVTLCDAARRALAGGDMRAASALLSRALAEPPPEGERAGVLTALGLAEALIDAPAASRHLTEALEDTSDPPIRAAIAELLVRSLQFMERPGQAVEIGTRVLGELDPEHDLPRRRLEAALMEVEFLFPTGIEWVPERLEQARTAELTDYAAVAQLALSIANRTAGLKGTADGIAAEVSRALTGGMLMHEALGSVAQVIPASTLAVCDRPGQGIVICDEALRIAERAGSLLGYVGNRLFRAWCHARAGDLEETILDAEETYRAGLAYGTAPSLTWSNALLAEALIDTGDVDAAEAKLRRVRPLEEAPVQWHWYTFRLAWAKVALARGDAERALELAMEVGESYSSQGGLNPSYIPWRFRASEAFALLPDRGEEFKAFAEETLELARRWGAADGIGIALRHLAAADPARAEELLAESIAELERSEARLERARSLIELGAAQRRAKRKGASREPLRQGMDLAESCGASAVVDRARTELRASGMRVRRAAISGPESLTASERRAAQLAASGLSNREIAQQLFVTVKTVEVHLSSVYRKLDIRGRPQLASALGITP